MTRDRLPLSVRYGYLPFTVIECNKRLSDKTRWIHILYPEGYGDASRAGIRTFSPMRQFHFKHTVSMFNPTIAEFVYRNYCQRGGAIIDPFAGGIVRGGVAGKLGYSYLGVDVRADQVAHNKAAWRRIRGPFDGSVRYIAGDSAAILPGPERGKHDLLFSCPPYGSLEVYSSDPADISTRRDYGAFMEAYGRIIEAGVVCLKGDAFAALVVGNFRDKRTGALRNFAGDTVRAFKSDGCILYNDAIILRSFGSAAFRAESTMRHGKLVRVHESLLIFAKGDPVKAFGRVKADRVAPYSMI